MKKILTLFILTTVFIMAFTVCAYAEDGASISTVYEKALEWWSDNEAEITSVVSLAATAVFGMFYSKIKSGINDLISKNGFLVNANTSSTKTLGDLIVGYNSQVDEIKVLKKEVDELKALNQQVSDEITVIKKEIAMIAHIISTAYTNSKALPQGTKNIINLECAECMKIAGETDITVGGNINEDIESN